MMYIENIVTSAKKIILENHTLALTFVQYFFSVRAIHRLVHVHIVFFLYEGNQVLLPLIKESVQYIEMQYKERSKYKENKELWFKKIIYRV